MDQFRLKGGKSYRGVIRVPGDKSISHRALILAGLGDGVTEVVNLCPGEDNGRTLQALRLMGLEFDEVGPGNWSIKGRGLYGLQEPADVINAGNSGSTMRLLCGLLAGQPFFSTITGDDSLRWRPMDRVVSPLRQMGACINGRQRAKYAPLAVTGSELKPIRYRLPVASAQVKSALLLAGLYAHGETWIEEPVKCRDHTERLLSFLGAELGREGDAVIIRGGCQWKGARIVVPGDISSAAYFLVAGLLAPDSEVTVEDVGLNPTRAGFIDALEAMGGDINVREKDGKGPEPVGDITVRSSLLKGIKLSGADIPGILDEIPILAVAATLAQGVTEIRDAAELRVKESDRIGGLVRNLNRFGAQVEELADGLRISGGKRVQGCLCDSFGDHRMAMALVILGSLVPGETVIQGPECVTVSFPEFFEIWQKVVY